LADPIAAFAADFLIEFRPMAKFGSFTAFATYRLIEIRPMTKLSSPTSSATGLFDGNASSNGHLDTSFGCHAKGNLTLLFGISL
jgi:hypothetical protein